MSLRADIGGASDQSLPSPGTIWIRHPEAGGWMLFQRPSALLTAHRPGDIPGALSEIERCVAAGRWAAGFIAYEAAPAFDKALQTQPAPGFPLLFFGIYDPPELALQPPCPAGLTYQAEPWQSSTDRAAYNAAIACVRSLLAEGATYQVNYTVRLRSRIKGEPWAFFLKLAEAQQADYSSYIDTGDFIIASASPELFFSLAGRELVCKPMKGTAARGRTLEEDLSKAESLRHSEKEQAENVMIVDMIRNDMSRVAAPATVAVPHLFSIERYPTIWQMTSTVSARTVASAPEIFAALFPCASITGAPKPNTMRIIAGLETTPRRIYTGCIGYWAPGRRARFSVAIRTVLLERAGGAAEYGVGGGIVWDSEAAGEYDECLNKAVCLSEPNEPFCLLETMLWTADTGCFLLEEHLRRMAQSAEYFGFPFKTSLIRQALEHALAGAESAEPLRVRMLLASDGRPHVETRPFEPAQQKKLLRVTLAADPIDPENRFLYHKTTRRRLYEEARAARPGYDDVLLWNKQGELTESTIANILIEQESGPAVTPAIQCGLLPGLYREYLLKKGEIKEGIVRLTDIKPGMRLELINSLRGRMQAILETP